MDISQHETVRNFFQELEIPLTHSSSSLRQLASADSRFLRDLKLNVASVLNSSNMTKKEGYLLSLAVAVSERHELLINTFESLSRKENASEEEIAETHACAAVMNLNNVFYRFRHYMNQVDFYEKQPAGLRMSVMMNPVLGKEFFELMSIVVSAVNGCERCVTSHEQSVKMHGASEPRIFDAARLAAVMKSLCVVL